MSCQDDTPGSHLRHFTAGAGIRVAFLTLLFFALQSLADTHYVNSTNPSPSSPYTDWSTAATTIQQALDESDGIVAHAAKRLHMRRTTLVEKLRKYGLQRQHESSGF